MKKIIYLSIFFFQYSKPSEFLEMEKMIARELNKTKATNDGDVECKPS
jgi:hypothetical protein